MDTGLPDAGGDSEAEPVLQEQPSGEVDYNNGYEGKIELEMCKKQNAYKLDIFHGSSSITIPVYVYHFYRANISASSTRI